MLDINLITNIVHETWFEYGRMRVVLVSLEKINCFWIMGNQKLHQKSSINNQNELFMHCFGDHESQ